MEFKIFIPNFVPKQKSYKCNHYLSYELNIKHGKTSILLQINVPICDASFCFVSHGETRVEF